MSSDHTVVAGQSVVEPVGTTIHLAGDRQDRRVARRRLSAHSCGFDRLNHRILAGMLLLVACGGGDAAGEPHPIVAEIGPALDALEPGTELFQVSGTPEGVELVVSDDGEAVGYTYVDGLLSTPDQLGAATGLTFLPADVGFDPAHVLDGVTDELDDPVVTRFEVIAGPQGVVYSALVLSDAGGVLQVDLSADGAVQSVSPLD